MLGRLGVSAMPRDGCLVPRVAATGAVRDVLSSMQERRWQTAIGATVEVDHIDDILTRVAMHEEPGSRGAALLASLGIDGEPLAPSPTADGKVEPVAEPNAESLIRLGLRPVVATSARPLRLRLSGSTRVLKNPIEPLGVDRHLPGVLCRTGAAGSLLAIAGRGCDRDCVAHASATAAAARAIPPRKRNIVRGSTDEISCRTSAMPDCRHCSRSCAAPNKPTELVPSRPGNYLPRTSADCSAYRPSSLIRWRH